MLGVHLAIMMNRCLRILLGVALVSISLPGLGVGSSHTPATASAAVAKTGKFDPSVARKMSAEALRRRQKSKAKTIILDTRETIDSEVLDGAYNVPVELIEAWARNKPKSTFIVTYCTCSDDGLAIDAVLALQRLGFTNAYVLEGGVDAARAAGIPMGHFAG